MTSNDQGPPRIFDANRITQRLTRRLAIPGAEETPDFVTELVIADMHQRLAPISRHFKKALIIGPIANYLPQGSETVSGPITFERASTLTPWEGQKIDPENPSLTHQDYDLIVSLLDMQTVNDVPGFLRKLRQHLAPDGLMLAAAIGGNSFASLRAAWLTADTQHSGGVYARIVPFIDVRDAGALLQHAGFALPVADIEHHQVRYANPLALMQEIKSLGASNPLADQPTHLVTRTLLMAACEAYAEIAGDPDGRVRAELDILWLSGWAPHESQQKPLKPGSAKVSLTEVLKPSNK
jgi:SAM-dependent methyltransferase